MAKQKDPNEIVHVQVKEGTSVVHKGISYGPRATLQVPRHVASDLKGVEEVHPHDVPDVAARK